VRLWSVDLLKFLPDLQFKGQLREMMLILHQWRDEGKTNHLLINKVMEYDKRHLTSYFLRYCEEYKKRYRKEIDRGIVWEFLEFANYKKDEDYKFSIITNKIVSVRLVKEIFPDWHNKEYLRVCMANLYEKHIFGVGKSRITDEEWETLLRGYKEITGENYVI
jgi:uncharacterized protein (TIGR02328 family)